MRKYLQNPVLANFYNPMINICYCLHIKKYSYLYILAASIVSVLNNTNEDITINILHDETFTNEYKYKFVELVA